MRRLRLRVVYHCAQRLFARRGNAGCVRCVAVHQISLRYVHVVDALCRGNRHIFTFCTRLRIAMIETVGLRQSLIVMVA